MWRSSVFLIILYSGTVLCDWHRFSQAGILAIFPTTPNKSTESNGTSVVSTFKDCTFRFLIPSEELVIGLSDKPGDFLLSVLKTDIDDFGMGSILRIEEEIDVPKPWFQILVSASGSDNEIAIRKILSNQKLYTGEIVCPAGQFPPDEIVNKFFNGISIGVDNRKRVSIAGGRNESISLSAGLGKQQIQYFETDIIIRNYTALIEITEIFHGNTTWSSLAGVGLEDYENGNTLLVYVGLANANDEKLTVWFKYLESREESKETIISKTLRSEIDPNSSVALEVSWNYKGKIVLGFPNGKSWGFDSKIYNPKGIAIVSGLASNIEIR